MKRKLRKSSSTKRLPKQKKIKKNPEKTKQDDKPSNDHNTTLTVEVEDTTPLTVEVADTTPSADDNSLYLTDKKFDDFGLSVYTNKALKEVMKYNTMTLVQEMAIPHALRGADLIASAKTGSGKTLAFLIPVVEAISKIPHGVRMGSIHTLVVCPVRELAKQIKREAEKLITYHNQISVKCVCGGTARSYSISKLNPAPNILVGTPGRLVDLTKDDQFAKYLQNIKVLILDEADRLLDMGFSKQVNQILEACSKKRQTMLFSATFPKNVKELSGRALKSDYQNVATVAPNDFQQQVTQGYIVCESNNEAYELYYRIKKAMSLPNCKIMVFFGSAKVTALFGTIFNNLGIPVICIHSRLSQGRRNAANNLFQSATSAVLFSSDVSARGLDYQNVSQIIQIGTPLSTDVYIHRIGRTARAGKSGTALLILSKWESPFLNKLKQFPLVEIPPASQEELEPLIPEFKRAIANVSDEDWNAAYQAWLGSYKSLSIAGSREELVSHANAWFSSLNQYGTPVIKKIVAQKMGMMGVKGLVVTDKKR